MDTKNKFPQSKCQPCEGMSQLLNTQVMQTRLANLANWTLGEQDELIYREYRMKNFMAAIDFINQVAQIAESENHHPDIHLTGYRRLRIELSTHAIGGLSENDFIVAGKINALPVKFLENKPDSL